MFVGRSGALLVGWLVSLLVGQWMSGVGYLVGLLAGQLGCGTVCLFICPTSIERFSLFVVLGWSISPLRGAVVSTSDS